MREGGGLDEFVSRAVMLFSQLLFRCELRILLEIVSHAFTRCCQARRDQRANEEQRKTVLAANTRRHPCAIRCFDRVQESSRKQAAPSRATTWRSSSSTN